MHCIPVDICQRLLPWKHAPITLCIKLCTSERPLACGASLPVFHASELLRKCQAPAFPHTLPSSRTMRQQTSRGPAATACCWVCADGSAAGIFLLNSNGMDVELQETRMTYRCRAAGCQNMLCSVGGK
jgi:hypothetical protein